MRRLFFLRARTNGLSVSPFLRAFVLILFRVLRFLRIRRQFFVIVRPDTVASVLCAKRMP
jgi:hypothetical protein